MRDVRALVGKDVTIRFAHFELEVGVREALDSLARTYEREHPHVNVEQIAVPQQFYKQWIRTQLVGGIPPDIIEVFRAHLLQQASPQGNYGPGKLSVEFRGFF